MGEGNVVEEIEIALKDLRLDLNELKKKTESDSKIIRNDLFNKATKEEINQLDITLTQKIEFACNNLRDLFPDKDALSKKLISITK